MVGAAADEAGNASAAKTRSGKRRRIRLKVLLPRRSSSQWSHNAADQSNRVEACVEKDGRVDAAGAPADERQRRAEGEEDREAHQEPVHESEGEADEDDRRPVAET